MSNVLLIILGVMVSCGTYQPHQQLKVNKFATMTDAQHDCLDLQIGFEECDRVFVEQCLTNEETDLDECRTMFHNCRVLEHKYYQCETTKKVNQKTEEIYYETCYDDKIIRN